MSINGKGSKQRPTNHKTFADNNDRVLFNKTAIKGSPCYCGGYICDETCEIDYKNLYVPVRKLKREKAA